MRLNLVDIPIDIAALLRNADGGLGRGELDLGYHVHGWLGRCVAKGAFKPFVLRERSLLGYSALDGEALEAQVSQFASPAEHAVVCGAIRSKLMPVFAPGTRVDVDVRVIASVRLASAVGGVPKGGEVGVWAARVLRGQEDGLDEQAVLRRWVTDRMGDAVVVERAAVVRQRRVRLLRRTQGSKRRGVVVELPEVSFSMTVTTQEGFDGLLLRGIGRHRAFGFGMLLLRPPTC